MLHTGGQAVNTEHRAQNRYFTPDQPCHWHTHVDDILGFETSGWLTPIDLEETVSSPVRWVQCGGLQTKPRISLRSCIVISQGSGTVSGRGSER